MSHGIIKILLVEDNRDDIFLFRHMFEEAGKRGMLFNLKCAGSLSESFEILLREEFDVILLDLGLPDSRGLDTLENLKKRIREIPVIVLTDLDDKDSEFDAVKKGALDYLVKGKINSHWLIHSIYYAIERKKEEKRLHRRLATEEILTAISKRFINITPAGFDKDIKWALKILGEFFDVDCCRISIISDDEYKIDRVYMWAVREIEVTAPKFAGLSLKYFTWMTEKMKSDGYVCIPQIQALPPEAKREKELYEDCCICSLLSLSLLLRNRLAGFLCFYTVKREKTWCEEDIGFLKLAGTIFVNVLERRRAEEERIRLATAIEQAGEGVVITDRHGNIQYVNPALEKITGYSYSEILGQNPRIFRSGKHNKDFYEEMWNTITSGRIWRGHIINRKKEGTLCEVDISISPLRDGTGTITSYVSVMRDVTDKLELERQFRHAQKMEAIGTLAGGIAHDFNNILGAIMGYTELLQYDFPWDAAVCTELEGIINASNRAKDLIKQILTFSRQSKEERKLMRPAVIIKEVLKFLRASLPGNIVIIEDIDADSGVILADPSQIHQVLMNLCTNAFQAMEKEGGVLETGLCRAELDEKASSLYKSLEPGPYLRLTVKDTGRGMREEIMERIFEPYFTTKEENKGTGLGLSVVHGIIKNHGGAITVESEPGKGTVFHIFLPEVESDGVMEREMKKSLPAGSEKVLFVDDEEALLDIGKRVLNKLGYEVVATGCSIKALEIFRLEPDKFDIIITDQSMPKMTGIRLAEEILAIRPGIPVILCSGFSEDIDEEKIRTSGIKELLFKPFNIKEIAESIRKVLGESQG